MKYKRVLLKISGEQLAGEQDFGIDLKVISKLADEITDVVKQKVQIAIVVGGGNFLRGADFAGHGVERATADYMGMLATVMNGLALMDLLEHHGVQARLQTNIQMNQVAEPFIRRRAIRHMEKGRVVVVAGGLGKPYLTTDTAAASVALELGCDLMLKATKVDGIYNKDPNKHDDATKLDNVSFQHAMENGAIKVMDKAALGLAMEQELPIVVFDMQKTGNILKAVSGQPVGTKVV
jgi:uridylate kinase